MLSNRTHTSFLLTTGQCSCEKTAYSRCPLWTGQTFPSVSAWPGPTCLLTRPRCAQIPACPPSYVASSPCSASTVGCPLVALRPVLSVSVCLQGPHLLPHCGSGPRSALRSCGLDELCLAGWWHFSHIKEALRPSLVLGDLSWKYRLHVLVTLSSR